MADCSGSQVLSHEFLPIQKSFIAVGDSLFQGFFQFQNNRLKIWDKLCENFLSSATTIDSIVWKEAICTAYSNIQNEIEFSVKRCQVGVRIFPRVVHSPKFAQLPESTFARINAQNFFTIQLEAFSSSLRSFKIEFYQISNKVLKWVGCQSTVKVWKSSLKVPCCKQ